MPIDVDRAIFMARNRCAHRHNVDRAIFMARNRCAHRHNQELDLEYAMQPGRYAFLVQTILERLPHGDALSVLALMEKAFGKE